MIKTTMNNEKITVITCTGDRFAAFNLLCKFIMRQTIKNFQWVIVDDGKISLQEQRFSFPSCADYIRREPQLDDPRHTLNLNMFEAFKQFKQAEGRIVLIMEDDEYYHPQYIERMFSHLENSDIAGSNISRYYHLPSGGWFINRNSNFCSLSQTGFKETIFPIVLEGIKSNQQYLDYYIWTNAMKVITCIFDDSKEPLSVGMKSLPGRKGIGIGHKENTYSVFDKDYSILKQWIPDNYESYLGFVGK